jgi:transcriptional regulator with XRE-family HTH domain
VIVAGGIAAITAAVGLLNLRLTRSNLVQQRELERVRADEQRTLEAQRAQTQVDAASRIGISRDTLSDLERGIRRPTVPTLAKIAEGYDVDVEELLEEPEVLLGKAEAPRTGPAVEQAGISEVSDIEELRQMARDLKAEWNRIGVEIHDRAVAGGLSNEEYRQMDRRMKDIEGTILAAKTRAQELREKLDEYEAEGVFELVGAAG